MASEVTSHPVRPDATVDWITTAFPVSALSQLLTGLVCTALRSEPVRTVSEVGFEDWLKHRLCGCLNHAISNGRYT
jgi:hypothetical protein